MGAHRQEHRSLRLCGFAGEPCPAVGADRSAAWRRLGRRAPDSPHRHGGNRVPDGASAPGRARLRTSAANVWASTRLRPIVVRGLRYKLSELGSELEGPPPPHGCRSVDGGSGNTILMPRLFLQGPSYEGFDGGAGARYQGRREIQSFWYPTWLAQPAALVEGSKLIDAPPHRLKFDGIAPELNNRDLVVMHTATPSFKADVRTAERIKTVKPDIKIGLIGAKVAVEPEKSLIAAPAVDFVARNEFDFTIKEVADGRPWKDVKGLSYRNPAGVIVHNENREVLENMDALPWVTPVYKRDLTIENYFGGYLLHPYISFYTGRGCKSRCTFCLWPQTVGGHRYRVRSVEDVVAEMKWAKDAFPNVKEFFFDDDTLTDNLPRVEALAKELGKLGVTWSCNAKANVPRRTLEIMKEGGLRLLLVGYESGNQQILFNIKKGMRIDVAKR